MDLTPAQRKQLHTALVEAFPSWGDLRLLTDLELGVNLATISAEQNINMASLDLIYWALKEGRLAALIDAMCAARPSNPAVLACRDLRTIVPGPNVPPGIPASSPSEGVTVTLLSAQLDASKYAKRNYYTVSLCGFLSLLPHSGQTVTLDQRTSYILITLPGKLTEKRAMRWKRYGVVKASLQASDLTITEKCDLEVQLNLGGYLVGNPLPINEFIHVAERIVKEAQKGVAQISIVLFLKASSEPIFIEADLPPIKVTEPPPYSVEKIFRWQFGYPPHN